MVGVPTSRGCLNCRRRKKGCDRKPPRCGSCIKLGLQCKNYGHELKFVPQNPGASRHEALRSNQTHGYPLSDSTVGLHRTALQGLAMGTYWDVFAPYHSTQSAIQVNQYGLFTSVNLVQLALGEMHSDSTLKSALLALSLARTGRLSSNRDMQKSALSLYSSTMSSVRKSLDEGARLYDDTVLATVMLLGLFEVQEGNDQRASAWRAHVAAATKLIILRGSSNLVSGIGRQLYLSHLSSELINAIGSRNKLPSREIDASTYAALPGSGIQDMNTAAVHIRLFEIMSGVPPFLAAADAIKSLQSPVDIYSALLSLSHTTQSLMSQFSTWHLQLQSLHAGPLHWPEPSSLYLQLPKHSLERVYPTCHCFVNLGVAYQELMHWTSVLLLHTTLHQTRSWIRNSRPEIPSQNGEFLSQLSWPDPLETWSFPTHDILADQYHQHDIRHTLVRNIIHSFEYFMRPSTGLAGIQLITFPLGVLGIARGHFQDFGADEAAWLKVIFKQLRDSGIMIEEFLNDMSAGRNLQATP